MDRDTALEQALAHALKENKENKEEIERLKDLVKESEEDRICKFQERFCQEDEHGNWSIKEGCSAQFHVLEDLLDYLAETPRSKSYNNIREALKESETGEQEDKPAVTITLSFDVPTFGKFISLMRTNDELWPDFKESLMQLKDKIESWKEMK